MQTVIENIDAVAVDDLLTLAQNQWPSGSAALTMLGPGVEQGDLSGVLDL
jgi:hypothetical protein